MVKDGIFKFSGKNVLLLQGPVGPFFYRLAQDLKSVGAQVTKVNFNGGDWLFYPTNCLHFRQSVEEWQGYLENLLVEKKIDVIFLFGDCREIHEIARAVATKKNIEVGVFEEGYVRPKYVTLEKYGVNGYSKLPKNPEFYFRQPNFKIPAPTPTGTSLGLSMFFAILYWVAALWLNFLYPKYRHHRDLNYREAFYLIPWAWRKVKYSFTERNIQSDLITKHAGNFYLVPLQVYRDSQIVVHSDFSSNCDFLSKVIRSFAANAPQGTILAIKHHPGDRGYNDYTRVIKDLCWKYDVEPERCIYMHDQHLPTILPSARGVVVINTTVGMQALHYRRPLKACGKAIYDIPGLTFQGDLDEFWLRAGNFQVNDVLWEKFRNYVIGATQLNGSIYRPMKNVTGASALSWPRLSIEPRDMEPQTQLHTLSFGEESVELEQRQVKALVNL